MGEEDRSSLRSSCTQDLVPPRFREQSQHGREQQCAHEQDPDTDARRVGVKGSLFVFDQVVQQVDWHYQ